MLFSRDAEEKHTHLSDKFTLGEHSCYHDFLLVIDVARDFIFFSPFSSPKLLLLENTSVMQVRF